MQSPSPGRCIGRAGPIMPSSSGAEPFQNLFLPDARPAEFKTRATGRRLDGAAAALAGCRLPGGR